MTGRDTDDQDFSFAAYRPRGGVDPAMRRIAVIAGGISLAVIAAALLWAGVRPGGRFGPPPEIAAPPGPMRVAPSNPGGLEVPGANEPILSGQAPNGAPELAPAAQAPDLSAFTNSSPPLPPQAGPAPPAVPAPPAPASNQGHAPP